MNFAWIWGQAIGPWSPCGRRKSRSKGRSSTTSVVVVVVLLLRLLECRSVGVLLLLLRVAVVVAVVVAAAAVVVVVRAADCHLFERVCACVTLFTTIVIIAVRQGVFVLRAVVDVSMIGKFGL